ncbi:hypothetical protein [Thioclava atlantica]|uniref:hypothetical protein n=1 Tax=Thioclava atlantica TaxID=1317124 RepID=UPI0012E0A648|nr:hypothetical protein [Thioclava atlantica]
MKTESVWIADLHRDGTNVVTDLDFDRDEPARKAILSGGEPRSEDLPIVAFEKYEDGPIKRLPSLFIGAGGIVISGELAAPLLKFDLGRTLVLPLRIFKHDRKTEIFLSWDTASFFEERPLKPWRQRPVVTFAPTNGLRRHGYCRSQEQSRMTILSSRRTPWRVRLCGGIQHFPTRHS